MATITQVGNKTVIPVGDVGSTTTISTTNGTPNIKRNFPLYRYGKSSLLGRKGWKDGTIIVYNDSTMKIFKQIDGHKKLVATPIHLEDVILDVAFGTKAAAKYGAPSILGNETNFITQDNFIAVPETKDRKKIHWFAAKDEQHLREIMRAMADTIGGKVRPPNLGKGPFGRYFNQDETEKWITYWTAQQHRAAEVENGEHQQQHHVITNQNQNLHNQPAYAPTTKSKQTTKSPPLIIRQVVEIPNKIETLRLQRDNLMDETTTNTDEYTVVRLIGGRRVKQSVTKNPLFQHPSGGGDYEKNGHHGQQQQQSYKSEISTYVKGEKPPLTTTNITISAPVQQQSSASGLVPVNNNSQEQFSQHRERKEIVSDNEKTIINLGSAERVVSSVDDSNKGAVTYTTKTTKERSYHRSTVTSTNE